MAIKQLNPYLNFNGTAEQAIKLYESALGAKADNVMRFGDQAGMPVAPADKNRVMHAVLKLGAGTVMISDTMPNQPVSTGRSSGNCVHQTGILIKKQKHEVAKFLSLIGQQRVLKRSRTLMTLPNPTCSAAAARSRTSSGSTICCRRVGGAVRTAVPPPNVSPEAHPDQDAPAVHCFDGGDR